MYTGFFGLNEKPFAITPDPRYLYMSERHAEALAHLLYGINEAGGFIELTGEVGTGKTTVVRTLLGQIPKDAEVALVLNPNITPSEFLLTICEELSLPVADVDRGSVKALVDILNWHLLDAHARGRRVVVIVDEAQNLSPEVLEQVRLLTNLETPTQKLLQIILIGQPELRELLKRVELRQLAQRITGRYHLDPLSRAETAAYVRHRLRVAGTTADLFSNGALREVHRLSRGIPRVINVLCDRALLGAYTQEAHRLTAALVRRSASEVYGRPVLPMWGRWLSAGTAVAAAAVLIFAGWRWYASHESRAATPVVANTQASPAPTAAKPATPSPPALAELLKAHSDETTTDPAFAKLFALWGAAFKPKTTEPCQQAAQQGLECVMQRGSWGQLRALNRPAILMLRDDQGTEHQIVVAGLGDEQVSIELSGEHQPVSIADVSRYWFGDFLVLWRPRVSAAKQLSAGMRGAEVRWLRQSLEKVNGAPPADEPADIYDQGLVRLVQDFQRDHQLAVDGIAGLQTQIALDTALADPTTPFLRAPAAPAPGS